jgi:D-alanine-D-alanine ligase
MNKKNARRCDVALLVDEETGEYGRDGRFIPEDEDVEEKVLRALRRSYARVEVVPFTRDVKATVRWLRRLDPRIVMNLTEWLDGDRTQDAVIARVLDRMGVTYTGPGPRGLSLARDKARSKRIAGKAGIAVPRHFVVERNSGLNGHRVTFPLLVKPQFGDGSEGIHASSVAGDVPELRERIRLVHAWHRQPAVCEEFIQGNDVYVALLGNEPRVLQPVELVVRSRHPSAPRFATYRLKNDPRYRARWGAHYRPARLEASTRRSLEAASRKLFHALGLRDYARLDFRLTEEGRFYFIEANPNPDLDPHALNRSGCFAGVPYVRLLRTIIESARKRQRRES